MRRNGAPRLLLMLALTMLSFAPLARAQSQPPEDPKKIYDEALSLYALGHYAEAAPMFEHVFELKHLPALLYNAAQAYRLAGNLEHALTLYQSYLQVYGDPERRGEVEAHIVELKRAIEERNQHAPPASSTVATPASGAQAASATVTAPAVAPKPWWKRPWVWGVVGGAVVIGVAVGVGVGVGARPSAPQPTYGAVRF